MMDSTIYSPVGRTLKFDRNEEFSPGDKVTIEIDAGSDAHAIRFKRGEGKVVSSDGNAIFVKVENPSSFPVEDVPKDAVFALSNSKVRTVTNVIIRDDLNIIVVLCRDFNKKNLAIVYPTSDPGKIDQRVFNEHEISSVVLHIIDANHFAFTTRHGDFNVITVYDLMTRKSTEIKCDICIGRDVDAPLPKFAT